MQSVLVPWVGLMVVGKEFSRRGMGIVAAVRMVDEVALILRKIPEELCGAVPAWVVDGGWAACEEDFHRLDVVEV